MDNQEQFCAAGRLWDEIDDRVAKATGETLESTTRMLSIVEDTKKIGVSTLTELNYQGEKLQNIQRKEEGIAEDVAYIKRLLKSALGCCQWCSCEGFFKTNKVRNILSLCIKEIPLKITSVYTTILINTQATTLNESPILIIQPTEKPYKTGQHGIVTVQPQTSCLKWSLSDQLNPTKSSSVTEHKIDQNLRYIIMDTCNKQYTTDDKVCTIIMVALLLYLQNGVFDS